MKKLSTLLGTTLLAFAASQSYATLSWYNGHGYEVVTTAPGITWAAANTAANSVPGGHLVTITSAGEDQFVRGLLGGYYYWAGGYQNPSDEATPKAGWTWVNGEGAFPGDNSGPGYANWDDSEPNDFIIPEQFLSLTGFALAVGYWNDLANPDPAHGYAAQANGYVVEVVPEPTTLLAGALLLLPFGASALRLLRRNHSA